MPEFKKEVLPDGTEVVTLVSNETKTPEVKNIKKEPQKEETPNEAN